MFSGIKKLFIFVVLVGGGLYFAAQWKVDKELKKELVKIAPYAEVSYDKSSINLAGVIKVEGVRVRSQMMPMTINIGEVAWSLGNIYQTLMADVNIQAGKFPAKVYMSITDLALPLAELADQIPPIPPGPTDILSTATCGNVQNFGVTELLEMGYDRPNLSLDVTLHNDEAANEYTMAGMIKMAAAAKVNYEFVMDRSIAMGAMMMGSPEEAFRELKISVVDEGYNNVEAAYCSGKEGIKNSEYLDKHIAAVRALFESVDLIASEDLYTAYRHYKSPNSEVSIAIKPEPNVKISDMGFYDFETIRSMLNLEIKINERPLTRFFENWETAKFQALIAQSFAMPSQSENSFDDGRMWHDEEPALDDGDSENGGFDLPQTHTAPVRDSEKPGAIKSTEAEAIELEKAGEYIGRDIKLVRSSGKEYEGKLIKADGRKIWVVVSHGGGEATIPLHFSTIDEFYVLPE